MNEPTRASWARAEREDLAEARAASDARPLSERAEEGFRLYFLTIVELARRVSTNDELFALLDREPGASPTTRLREKR